MNDKKQIGAAIVTGAGKRVGKAIALALADAGYDIGVHYRSSDKDALDVAQTIKEKGRNAVALRADLSQESETASLIRHAVEALGPLNVLINSASLFEEDSVEDHDAPKLGRSYGG